MPPSYPLPPWFPQNKSISRWPVIIFNSLVLSLDQLHEVQWKDRSRYTASEEWATHSYTQLHVHHLATIQLTLLPQRNYDPGILQTLNKCCVFCVANSLSSYQESYNTWHLPKISSLKVINLHENLQIHFREKKNIFCPCKEKDWKTWHRCFLKAQ